MSLRTAQKQNKPWLHIISTGNRQSAYALNELMNHQSKLEFFVNDQDNQDSWNSQVAAQEPVSCVRLNYEGIISGNAEVIFPKASARQLIALLTREQIDSPDLNTLKAGTLTEIGNILMNGFMESFGKYIRTALRSSIPDYLEGTLENIHQNEKGRVIFTCLNCFQVPDTDVQGELLFIMRCRQPDQLHRLLQ